tara:strand:+ start:756 stop:1079 length:324 start_codon:yes stop_codon:yes gene_type:complete
MKKSPLNFGAFQIASRLFGRGGNSSGGGLENRVGRLERLMAEIRGDKIGGGTDDSIKSVQENIVNPPSSTMQGNIQPGAYNQTGFSTGAIDTADQVFNTPDERNKII